MNELLVLRSSFPFKRLMIWLKMYGQTSRDLTNT
uniref:Uncharacterized protein n=1 Tax=Arundo donax TaxID=35708 RepID=A0A0A8YT12_ARUDO